MEIRPAGAHEHEALARLWHDGWQEAHARIVPEGLVRIRTLASFQERVAAMGDRLRTCGDPGMPLGLCAVKGGEIDQLFVAGAARGTGLAAALLADGEARIATAGHRLATLHCAIGNVRAMRFYHKHGWSLRGDEEVTLAGPDGGFRLNVHVLEKRLKF